MFDGDSKGTQHLFKGVRQCYDLVCLCTVFCLVRETDHFSVTEKVVALSDTFAKLSAFALTMVERVSTLKQQKAIAREIA